MKPVGHSVASLAGVRKSRQSPSPPRFASRNRVPRSSASDAAVWVVDIGEPSAARPSDYILDSSAKASLGVSHLELPILRSYLPQSRSNSSMHAALNRLFVNSRT